MVKKFKLDHNLEKVLHGGSSDFLNPVDIRYLEHILNKMHKSYQVFRLFEEAEKLMIYQENLDISLLEIECIEKLTHQKILGSLFALGLEEDVFGDIIVGDLSYIVVKNKIKDYLFLHYKTIGKNKIVLKEVPLSKVKDYTLSFQEIRLNTTSLRIDNIIAKLVKISRSLALDMIHMKKITLNYQLLTNKNYQLKEDDLFSIRGYGKYKLEKILVMKNNKYQVIIKKYI